MPKAETTPQTTPQAHHLAPLFVGYDDVVAMTGLSRRKVGELVATGEVPHKRFGASVRFPLQRLRDWADEL